jgi:hypothetical protein
MSKARSIIAVALAGLTLSGCASAPWSAGTSASSGVGTPPATSEVAAAAPARSPTVYDPQQLQNMLAELQQLGPIDPVANDRLIEDLQQSDPAIWPLVIEQFRATQAYRRQVMSHSGVSELVRRLPPTNGESPARTETPQETYPNTSAVPSGEVVPSSYTSPTTSNWRQRLNDAIEALEAETPVEPATPVDVAQHARLRMLYAAAGRREDAARPIPDVSPATQQFLSKELEGLGTWLDAEQVADPARRAIEAKPALLEALAKLGETAPLLVRNAAFCSEVLSFACIKRFDKNEFVANQELLLYAEPENMVSEPAERGFHTSLRSAYEILDDLGRQVVRRDFAATEEYCKSARRDFFVSYRLRLPRQIAPGKFLLRLMIQDAISQKNGQASIEFAVKDGKAEGGKAKGEGGRGKGETETKT